ncbi:MAG: flagellar motor switch protein FliG [Aquificae bacterium]|nr:flagellar motor switch protein FliG [Aquificota bacterium]
MTREKRSLSKATKATLLLLSLPEDVSMNILKELSQEEIQKLFELAKELDAVPERELRRIAQELLEEVKEVGIPLKQPEEFIDALKKSIPPSLAEKFKGILELGDVEKTLRELEKVDSKVLANLIRSEHPQTIALFLSQLSPKKSAEVIKHLPDELRKEVVKRIATLENVNLQYVKELAQILLEEIRSLGVGEALRLEGTAVAAELLNSLDKETREVILQTIAREDPLLEERIREKMFTFEDIRKLSDRDIIEILKVVDKNTLMVALTGAPQDIKEKFLANMSKRAAKLFTEDMEALGAVKKSDVEKAQRQVVNLIRKMIDEGKIELGE